MMGTVTGAITWVPEPMPPLPLVVLAGVELGDGGAAGGAELLAVEPPSRPTDDEPRFMGTVIGATICVPEPMLLDPLVLAAGTVGLLPVPAECAPPDAVDEELPRIPRDVALRLMGAETGATTWVPERIPSLPLVVSAALAAVALRTIMPPAKHVPSRHLRRVVFMVIYS
ncbi:hypothetical protein GCM10010523_03560 [Paenarthrobacter ilicis]